MLNRLRSFLRDAWPFVGAAYLAYLAFRPPPVRYVGVGGLVVVTPLLFGWTVGRLFGVGPWADSAVDERKTADGNGNGTVDENGSSDEGGPADGSGMTDGNEAPNGPTTGSEPAGSDDTTDGGTD